MTLERLVNGLHQRSAAVEVVAPNRTDRQAPAPPGSLRYRLLSVPGLPIPRYPELRFGLPATRRLLQEWSQNRPDLVHVATEGPLGWSAIRAASRLRIPLVSSFHTNFHSYGRHYGYGWLTNRVLAWLRRLHNRTLRTFVPSEDVLRQLEAAGFANLRLFSRGVDTDLFGPHQRDDYLRLQWGASLTTPVALYVGRLAAEKNLHLTLQAYQQLRQTLPDLLMVMVGHGPERERIARQFPEIHFAGMRTGTDLARHYASADTFLFASLTETFGNVVTEAMASGLPVLAFNYAAPARFISDNHNGFLAPYDQPEAFLRRARDLAEARPLWPAIGTRARQTMLPHAWDSVIDRYFAECQSLLPQPAPL